MGSFSDYLENCLLNHTFMGSAYTQPTNIFVALSTTDPLDAGSGITEPSGGSYARKSTAGADWSAASSGALSNGNAITFVEATASWGNITHFCLYDHATAGNMLAHGALTTAKTIDNGDTASFAAGDLDVSLD